MNIAINGFGRIGRLVFRNLIARNGINIVAVNDLTSLETLAHLLKYDSAHGIYDEDIEAVEGFLKVGDKKIHGYAERNPEKLPWKDLKVDVVIEATGAFRTKELMEKHITAGAQHVLLSS